MEYKDYYKILGISRSASQREIKRAYRRLAREYHPDRNPDDQSAEERFKEINEAHEILTDPEKRRRYDQLGASWQQWQRAGHNPYDFDFGQWFADRDGRGAGREYGGFDDLFGGGPGWRSDFASIFGEAGAQPRMRWRQAQARARRGRDYEQPVEITLEEAYHGTSRILQVDGSRLEAKIPPGSSTGLRVRLRGKGGRGAGGVPPGDLLLDIRVLPHERFERKGDDLHCRVPVDLYTAVLGGHVQVPTMQEQVRLKIPPETQSGCTFRLKGRGMPHLRQAGQYGDLFARVRVVLPQHLTPQERDLFEALARLRG